MNEREMALDLAKEPTIAPVLYLGQGDRNGTVLRVSLYDNGNVLDLDGCSVSFCMRAPGGLDYYEVVGTADGNVVEFLIDETYAAGHVGKTDEAYVSVTDPSDAISSTSRFSVVVLRNAKDGVVPAPAYVTLIEEFLENAQEDVDEAVAAAQAIVDYSVPLMSSTMRGGAKIGSGLTVEDETLSVDTSALVTQAEKGAANGVAELDQNGLVLSSQLPSYVDDVLEYPSAQDFPATGESGKIYVATDTNLTYRWTGSTYAEISPSLALGETSSTAYRGDRGAAAYAHAVTNKGAAFSSNLYKITTNSEGHVTAATPATSADIVAFLNAQALTPASVTATGAIQGTSISDSVGSLADLRGSVSLSLGTMLTFNNGFSLRGGSAYRKNGVIYFDIGITCTTAPKAGVLFQPFTINSGYRPKMSAFGGGIDVYSRLESGGIVKYNAIVSVTNYWIAGSYLVE